jgi:hypothetical protein
MQLMGDRPMADIFERERLEALAALEERFALLREAFAQVEDDVADYRRREAAGEKFPRALRAEIERSERLVAEGRRRMSPHSRLN